MEKKLILSAEQITERIYSELIQHQDDTQDLIYPFFSKDNNIYTFDYLNDNNLDIQLTSEKEIKDEIIEGVKNHLKEFKRVLLYTCKDNYMVSIDTPDMEDDLDPEEEGLEKISDNFYIAFD